MRKEISEILGDLLDRIAFVALTFGSLATAASLLRGFSQGWHLNILLDPFFFAAVVLIVLLRKKLPVPVVSSSILLLVILNAILNFFTLGLLTVGFVMLTASCVLFSLFFGLRYGLASLGMSIVLVSIAGYSVLSGRVQPFDISEAATNPWTWVSQLAGFSLYVVALIATVESIQRRLYYSLETLRKRTRDLQKQERTFRLLAENMRDVIFVQDLSFRVTYVSPSVKQLFGYTPEELRSRRLDETVTPESWERVKDSYSYYLDRAMKGELDNEEIPTMEFEYIRKDGSTFWGEMKPSFLRDAQGDLIGSQGVIRDITYRKEAERRESILQEQLFQSEKLQAVGELAGGIAHDFNNQLTSVIGMGELLRQDYPHDERIQDCVGGILGPARRAADLTSKLLAFARKTPVQNVRVDIHGIIGEVVAMLNRSIDKRIRIEQHLTAREATIKGDPTHIQNALLNIALNARDAMPEGGVLSFETHQVFIDDTSETPSLSRSGLPSIEIRIGDSGTGMRKEVLDRIFEPFFTTKPKGKGTGMGMAAVYGTVRQHNGTIGITTKENAGTIVSIGFPTIRGTDDTPETTAPKAREGSGTILLIEDEETVRFATSKVLERLGYNVIAVEDGRSGLQTYQEMKNKIDLVLLDLILPATSGEEVFSAMQRENPQVRIVIYSGYSEDGHSQKLLEKGALGFIQKPFEFDELASVMQKALQ